jgi:predicted dehydrogenase
VIRLGFLGVGWIGRNRMEAMLGTGLAEAVAICDPNPELAEQAAAVAGGCERVKSLDQLLALNPDGVVIATPSALHADQAIAGLNSGAAVFCQKPLGRTATEVEAVLEAARNADRLLGVDLSYRHTAAIQAIRQAVQSGELGHIFAADLVFHNAYGPGNAWFWDPKLSGGGCLIDLGIHLVDLALWLLDFPEVVSADARLLRSGRQKQDDEVEDFAMATIELAGGILIRFACSWNLPAGQDAIIRASFYGTSAGAEMINENGSFYDFTADLLRGRERQRIASPPDDWGGRAGVDWLRKLAAAENFEGSTQGLAESARLIDRLHEAAR